MPTKSLQHDDEANELARVAPSVPLSATGTTAQTANGLSQPTPGPWEVQDGIMVVSTALKGKLHFTDTEGVEHCAEKGLIALVYACYPDGEYHSGTSNANANLIAAAPDLATALTIEDIDQIIEGIDCFIIEDYEALVPVWQPYITKLRALRAAIQKAGGQ